MKNVFSKGWKSSVQPRKQRKYVYNLPEHARRELLSVHLSKPLREQHGTRAVPLRTGDKVRVVRGTHKGKEGIVERIDVKDLKVYVAKVEHVKMAGGVTPYPLVPSNLVITELAKEKRRFKKQE